MEKFSWIQGRGMEDKTEIERFSIGDGNNHNLKTKLVKDCIVILLVVLTA